LTLALLFTICLAFANPTPEKQETRKSCKTQLAEALDGEVKAEAALAECQAARIAKLESALKITTEAEAKGSKGGRVGSKVPDDAETAAGALLKEASGLAYALKYDEAKAKLAELKEKYGETRAIRLAVRLEREISIIGIDAGKFEVEKWYQGEVAMADGKATLLIFWEVWCPHCKREVPKMNETHNKYKDKGLSVVGLTKVSRNTTEEQVTDFIKEKDVQYPLAKEDGDNMSKRFGVSGIPAAAVVKDGKVVWRGHPARLSDELIESWL
jgi:peroxiredoxin